MRSRFWRFLRTDHRIARAEFIGTTLILLVLHLARVALGAALAEELRDSDGAFLALVFLVLLPWEILVIWAYFACVFRRGKDFGLHPVLAGLLCILCVGNVVLAVMPGEKGPNKYGEPPEEF